MAKAAALRKPGSDVLTWPHPDGSNWPPGVSRAMQVSVTDSCSGTQTPRRPGTLNCRRERT
jgi:hypothetical protein